MRTKGEDELAERLKSSVDSIDSSEQFLANVMERISTRVRKRRAYAIVGAVTTAIAFAAIGTFAWLSDSAPNGAATREESATSNATASPFDLTKEIALPILEREGYTDSPIALNQDTGEAVLYLPDSGTPHALSVATEIRTAVEAAAGAAPIAETVGTSLISELDHLASEIFDARDEWATIPTEVYLTHSDVSSVSIVVGVEDVVIAGDLPSTMQLASGATAMIRIEETGPPMEEHIP